MTKATVNRIYRNDHDQAIERAVQLGILKRKYRTASAAAWMWFGAACFWFGAYLWELSHAQ